MRVIVRAGLMIAFPASRSNSFKANKLAVAIAPEALLNLLLLTVELAACDSRATVWPRLSCM